MNRYQLELLLADQKRDRCLLLRILVVMSVMLGIEKHLCYPLLAINGTRMHKTTSGHQMIGFSSGREHKGQGECHSACKCV
jgi:hypothetical protein